MSLNTLLEPRSLSASTSAAATSQSRCETRQRRPFHHPGRTAVTDWTGCASASHSSAAGSTPSHTRRRVRGVCATPRSRDDLTNVVLADDQDLVRSGLRVLLEARGITVLAEAARPLGGGADAQPPPRRACHGHPHAGHGRDRGDPGSRGAGTDRARPHPHHLRPRRIRVPGASRRRCRIHAQSQSHRPPDRRNRGGKSRRDATRTDPAPNA